MVTVDPRLSTMYREAPDVLIAQLMCETWRRSVNCRMGLRMTTRTDAAVGRQLQNIPGHFLSDPACHRRLNQHDLSGWMISQRQLESDEGRGEVHSLPNGIMMTADLQLNAMTQVEIDEVTARAICARWRRTVDGRLGP